MQDKIKKNLKKWMWFEAIIFLGIVIFIFFTVIIFSKYKEDNGYENIIYKGKSVVNTLLKDVFYDVVEYGNPDVSFKADNLKAFAFTMVKIYPDKLEVPILFNLRYIGDPTFDEREVYSKMPKGDSVIVVERIAIKFNDDSKMSCDDVVFKLFDQKDNLLASTKCINGKIDFKNIEYKKGVTRVLNFLSFDSFKIQSGNSDYDFLYLENNIVDVTIEGKVKTSLDNYKLKTEWVYINYSNFKDEGSFYLTKQELLEKYSFLQYNEDDNTLHIPSGVYVFNENIVIPSGYNKFIIDPGVTLRMNKDISLVSYSPLVINGEKGNEVKVIPKNSGDVWGVIASIGDSYTRDFSSLIKYAYFEGGSETHINNAYLSGMVSIYKNKSVVVHDSIFKSSFSDDGLNIKNAYAEVYNNKFFNNSADAFDSDFLTGKVYNNLFVDNGNDSIDTSGSDLLIFNNTIIRSGDKCMSFGENSINHASDNYLCYCGIGVESKDGSSPTVTNNYFVGNQTAINTYKKKYFYESPLPVFTNNIFYRNKDIITFKNSFKGVLLDTDNSRITLQNNIFDNEINIDQNKCLDCKDNEFDSNIIIDNSILEKCNYEKD